MPIKDIKSVKEERKIIKKAILNFLKQNKGTAYSWQEVAQILNIDSSTALDLLNDLRYLDVLHPYRVRGITKEGITHYYYGW